MKKTYDFLWGNPYFLLEILEKKYNQKLAPYNIKEMSYAPNEGIPELIELTKKIIQETMGVNYKYIIITNGATQAINSILRFKISIGYTHVITHKYGYPFYDDMIKRAGFVRIEDNSLKLPKNENAFRLIDSPNNPLGIQTKIGSNNDIWDAVYHNRIYTDQISVMPNHKCMVGSYSKLLGVTGARVGFIATNDENFYNNVRDWSLKDTATPSKISQEMIIDILNKINLEEFIILGKRSLDNNREEFQKIAYLFDNQPIQETGMFWCVHADKKALKILDECNIKYLTLDGNYIRISLGQTNEITKEAVREILKRDKILKK